MRLLLLLNGSSLTLLGFSNNLNSLRVVQSALARHWDNVALSEFIAKPDPLPVLVVTISLTGGTLCKSWRK